MEKISYGLELENVTKFYKDFKALKNINLKVVKGEFLTILGPSGSGKTTLLKLIAGFEKLSNGNIQIDNQNVSRKKPNERNIGMLFQNYALFPHMTVFNNIAYPLKNRKIKKEQINHQVDQILELVDLKGYRDRFPKQLSGGQQQRVALARAIVFNPPFLLLDEPLSALDKNLRKQMQQEMIRIHKYVGATTIAVTHDQEEALTMSSRICVMKDGEIVQIDTPTNLYRYPNSLFVASFLGENNIFEGHLLEMDTDISRVRIGDNHIIGAKATEFSLEQYRREKKKEVFVAVRPENIKLSGGDNQLDSLINVEVIEKVYLGEAIKIKADFQGLELNIKLSVAEGESLSTGDKITVGWSTNDAILIYEKNNKSTGDEL
jgi:putative spermidine/putrescine transport system ATP-binding protein